MRKKIHMQHFIYYLVWTIIIGGVMYLGHRIGQSTQNYDSIIRVDNFVYVHHALYLQLFPVIIGMLLRAPILVKEIKEGRKWSLDYMKLLVIGIPAFYVTFSHFLWGISSAFFPFTLPFTLLLSASFDTSIITITGVIFGYILLDSIKE
ncbi:hypothetical protein QA612_13090 [Evansella sp. AB-P1]|uniref:hypothetical protein n=1 Tax=Evansella sp. AB-P1 TaxID=3037653 RepID=UPI00241FF669|nr:hypothetical protein [Evansella sp. AB-P1]MDG5788418.1 hypothetical protein [Evansella sp. AB-P1]